MNPVASTKKRSTSYKVISPPPFPFRIRGEEAAAVAFDEFPHEHYSGFCRSWQGTPNKETSQKGRLFCLAVQAILDGLRMYCSLSPRGLDRVFHGRDIGRHLIFQSVQICVFLRLTKILFLKLCRFKLCGGAHDLIAMDQRIDTG